MEYLRLAFVVACQLVAMGLVYLSTVLGRDYLHGLGVTRFDEWINVVGLVVLAAVAKPFFDWIIEEGRRGWPDSFRKAQDQRRPE